MAFSRLKDTYKTDKKAFFSNDRFRLPLRGRDIWGYFTVDTVAEIFGTGEFGEVFGTGKFMVGSWHTNHGSFGKYNGTFYGIRLDTVKKAFASITDQRLYQTMLNFESLKQGGTIKEHIGDTRAIEKNTSHVYTTNHSNEYHKSSCPKLGTEDLVEFTSSQQARNAGGKPCKNCNP